MSSLIVAALLAASQMSAADEKALHGYDLTAAKIDKLLAVAQKMKFWGEAHPEEARREDELLRGKTLDESVKRIESKPQLVSLMKSEGVTPHEFVLGMMAFAQASMWSALSPQMPDAKMPPEVNPRNVKLLQDHPEIMQKWEQAVTEKRQPDPAKQ